MAIRLESPPVREPMVDRNGNITKNWARWLTLLHAKTGGPAAVLPVSLGGTGADNVVDAIAIQTSAPSAPATGVTPTTVSNAQTDRQTFDLESPLSDALGDFADTSCTWTTAFPDSGYTLTANFIGSNGTLSLQSLTATGFILRLSNSRDGKFASGKADCIGVHP